MRCFATLRSTRPLSRRVRGTFFHRTPQHIFDLSVKHTVSRLFPTNKTFSSAPHDLLFLPPRPSFPHTRTDTHTNCVHTTHNVQVGLSCTYLSCLVLSCCLSLGQLSQGELTANRNLMWIKGRNFAWFPVPVQIPALSVAPKRTSLHD